MPDFAAHTIFGHSVHALLSPDLQTYLAPHKDYFTLGFQGPDLLFYHDPLKKDDVTRHGSALHQISPAHFFHAAPWNDARQVAYLLGLACHYGLDRACHAVVNPVTNYQSLPHLILESDFDLHIIDKAGYPRSRKTMIPKLPDYAPIAAIYGLDVNSVKRCGHHFSFYTSLLDYNFLKPLACKPDIKALFLPKKVTQLELCLELEALYDQAIPSTATLVTALYQWATNNQPFPTDFEQNFEGVVPVK